MDTQLLNVNTVFFQYIQKQPPRCIPKKKRPENMQQIYRRTPMSKCMSVFL